MSEPTPTIRANGVRAIVLDIEGTTTPIAFVHDVLFPFARAHLAAHLREARGTDELREVASRLAVEHAADLERGEQPPPWRAGNEAETIESIEAYACWLMDRDRKSPGLKLLQGRIWDAGYRTGHLRGEVFPDVGPAIQRWRAAGLTIAIYSSGSVLAQRLLFGSTAQGDITELINDFFDTDMGPKTSAASYVRIAAALGLRPDQILFVSDAVAELVAARAAGLQVLLSSRPGNAPQPDAAAFEAITGFDRIRPS